MASWKLVIDSGNGLSHDKRQAITCTHVDLLSMGHAMLSIVIYINPGPILGLRPANERRRYFVTTSLIGYAQT